MTIIEQIDPKVAIVDTQDGIRLLIGENQPLSRPFQSVSEAKLFWNTMITVDCLPSIEEQNFLYFRGGVESWA